MKADLGLDYIVPHHGIKDSARLIAKVGKSFPIGKLGKWDLALTPNVKAGYLVDWYGAKGLGYVAPGISIGAQKGNASLEAFIRRQVGNEKAGREDFTYEGITFGWKF